MCGCGCTWRGHICTLPDPSKWFGVRCLWGGVAWLTCMQNVGALRMLGECSTRCHLEMWSLEARWYWDMWNMGKGRRRWNYIDKYSSTVCSQTLLLLWGCQTHVLAWLHLKRAGVFITIALKVVWRWTLILALAAHWALPTTMGPYYKQCRSTICFFFSWLPNCPTKMSLRMTIHILLLLRHILCPIYYTCFGHVMETRRCNFLQKRSMMHRDKIWVLLYACFGCVIDTGRHNNDAQTQNLGPFVHILGMQWTLGGIRLEGLQLGTSISWK